MKQILSITKKELEGYFNSLLAIIFLGVFLAAVLFVFFTIEKFFARGVADVRPMFQWMPVLLIFLLAALTMRQWSEEQRSGTLEVLITMPVRLFNLVLGKFLAVMSMIVIALAMTLPIPIIVSRLGNLDWGPVFGGYLAAVLMAAAYAAIGLFISSRTDNQIVSLIMTVLIGGIFYMIGSSGITEIMPTAISKVLWAIGTGSRFESIQRGVIDLRDLVYYLSICGIFLLLNVISLDGMRWSRQQTVYRKNKLRTAALIGLNLLLINAWLYPLNGLRVDLTEQKEYTISQTTKDILQNLDEPLLLRGYFSERTHPYLSPLVPQITDMLREYEVASNGKIKVEIVDPLTDPDIEAEANQSYGIQPTPFQISDRNESSIINSYFDILVRYGDQSVVLGFGDLIEVSQTSNGMSVSLKNLEYDLTSAIKKSVYGFQSMDAILAQLSTPVKLTFFLSRAMMPDDVQPLRDVVVSVAEQVAEESNGKFTFEIVDPDDAESSIRRPQLEQEYGLQPYSVALFSQETYYFHLLLQNGEQIEPIYPAYESTEADIRSGIEAAIKRTSSGFLKVVGLSMPSSVPTQDLYGQTVTPLTSYQYITQQLSADYQLKGVDLSIGQVPQDVDVLMVIAPNGFSEMEYYAIDQYLMRGGAVIVADNPFKLEADPNYGSLMLNVNQGNLQGLLSHYGIDFSSNLIMDEQNSKFPASVTRDAGGYSINEIQAMNYPYFIDVRSDQMSEDNLIVSGVPAVSMFWSSAITLDETKNGNRAAEVLMTTSPNAWETINFNIQPDFDMYPEFGFPTGTDKAVYPLAVAVQGQFESYFAETGAPQNSETTNTVEQAALLESSVDGAQLVVFASSEFIEDFALEMSLALSSDYKENNLRMMQNAVDWSVEDVDLLAIRSRGTSTRILFPLADDQYTVWEIVAYVISVLLLMIVGVSWQRRQKKQQPLALIPLDKLAEINEAEVEHE
ncbi:MAG: Gldg family protein [Anaerolineaceae bacterium]|nr:Gldg family protein [Anaerolineaceae bacterium]